MIAEKVWKEDRACIEMGLEEIMKRCVGLGVKDKEKVKPTSLSFY